jgi:CBS domain-containing protein
MNTVGTVKDVMTKKVLAVGAEDGLDTIAQLFEKYDYDGIPVIGEGNKLLGIITAYEMVAQSSGMHLPTIVGIMDRIAVNKADKKELDAHFNKLRDIKAKQIMNTKPLTLSPETNLQDAAKMFAENHRVNPISVIDGNGVLVGVLSRYDLIKFFNEAYFQQVVEKVSTNEDPFQKFTKTKSQLEIESAVGNLSKEFLLVTKKRPRIWKIIAISTFIAGLIGATALIIRIVRKEKVGIRAIQYAETAEYIPCLFHVDV